MSSSSSCARAMKKYQNSSNVVKKNDYKKKTKSHLLCTSFSKHYFRHNNNSNNNTSNNVICPINFDNHKSNKSYGCRGALTSSSICAASSSPSSSSSTTDVEVRSILEKLFSQHSLTLPESRDTLSTLLSLSSASNNDDGRSGLSPAAAAQMSAFLVLLRAKGETADEV